MNLVAPIRLECLDGLPVYPVSFFATDDTLFFMAQGQNGRRLGLLTKHTHSLDRFTGERVDKGDCLLAVCPLNHQNAVALRDALAWLTPQPLGLRTSAGLGDRIGLATPGHVRAVQAAGGNIAPIFAQQSIREMARTGRTPQMVMDDATWGVFQEGWRRGVGADADHLKTPADIDRCAAAGFTFYTLDPSEHIDSAAGADDAPTIRRKYELLPWAGLEATPADLQARYVGKRFDLEHRALTLGEETLLRAAVKYGRAVAHVVAMWRRLLNIMNGSPFELEVSVDETATPTSPAEHIYIASELRRLGIRWVSLAPRFVGRFEKGVDYISPAGQVGDAAAFEADLAIHAAIARALGPYKLSLHSGSDKFSIYPAAMRQTRGLVHLKTAGASYLEALHTIASLDPDLFRAIYAFARERYETDRASYHVSARLERAPLPEAVADADLPALLNQFDAREVLHVTFGSVLTERTPQGRLRFYDRLVDLLRCHPDAYAANLEAHFARHLRPFAVQANTTQKG